MRIEEEKKDGWFQTTYKCDRTKITLTESTRLKGNNNIKYTIKNDNDEFIIMEEVFHIIKSLLV